MERVQVIKLYNGDQIICYAEEEKEQIVVKKPLQFFLARPCQQPASN